MMPPLASTGSNANSLTQEEVLLAKYEEALARIQELENENEELKLKQLEISTAKELYLKIFEDFPALIWRSRLDKLCDYFNRTWLEWTGHTMEQEYGNGWTKGIHPDDYEFCLETYVKAFDAHEPFYMEYRLVDKHGEYRWIGDHGRPFYDLDGTFLGYIGSCYDITENKMNQQKLVKLNATKDKFFSIVAHDLRNPISTFVSLSEYLMENGKDFDDSEMDEIAVQMHKDSKNTLLLLENLLEWSRAQTDGISYNPKPIKLVELFEEVVSQVELCAKAKRIAIKRVKHQGLTVIGDRNMLHTVLRNLLMNAIKFTRKGGAVEVIAEENGNEQDTANKTVVITVSDNGLGIAKENIPDLFSLVKDSRRRLGTDDEKGSGLGLIICRDFIEKHQGKIWAESELGKGTDIKFTIPRSV
uniref:histidine kinase n=1 Tax=Amphora coffeiformis TaxID=265554 RepID=A0A7S3LGT4_9STRA|mmetsp:Transcript_26977/g.50893  ORF Transcript_26977/g.50893 Transcript_26977/m.50893 type:complete len:415 (+) Transcript_26977:283-1527(+)|eukprot:scaffold8802_cov142-Amphora_coffeaeformis.AAC.1